MTCSTRGDAVVLRQLRPARDLVGEVDAATVGAPVRPATSTSAPQQDPPLPG
jgi:hypothetical protein